MSNSKNQIRKELLKKRRSLPKNFVIKASDKITLNFIKHFRNKNFKTVMLYSDFDNEPRTNILAQYFKNIGCALAYPLIQGDIIVPKIPVTGIKKGSFGILEPTGNDVDVPLDDLDIIIVPGIGFDWKRNRIGYGKGFYDKLLCKTDAIKAALSYSFQVLDKIPVSKNDIPMDIVITESEII